MRHAGSVRSDFTYCTVLKRDIILNSKQTRTNTLPPEFRTKLPTSKFNGSGITEYKAKYK